MQRALFQHEVFYPDNHGITLRDIAQTLVAQEKVVDVTRFILEQAFPGLNIEKYEVRLDRVQSGSLFESFLVAFFLAYQDDLEKTVPGVVEQLTGYAIPDQYKTLVTLLVFLLILGAGRLISTTVGKKATPPPAITGDYNTVLHVTAKTLHISADALDSLVGRALTGQRRRQLMRSAIDMFRPAKRNGNGRIQGGGVPEVSAAAVAEFPTEAALTELDETTDTEAFQSVEVEVRATDRDKRGTGWAGIIRAENFKRLPMQLYPTVDSDELAKARTVIADVLVEYKTLRNGETKPVRFHLLVVREILD